MLNKVSYEGKKDIDKILKNYKGKTIVIKYGGSIMKNEECKMAFLQDIAFIKKLGVNIVIVHGGGPNISKLLEKLNIESRFVKGLRVTDEKVMEAAEMVLSGKVNKDLSGLLSKMSINALGISGRDAGLIEVKKKYLYDKDEKIDIGYVGEVFEVNGKILNDLIGMGYVPVVSPVGMDDKGNTYNVNADYAAGAVSSAINAEKLIFMTDVPGVYIDINDEDSILKSVNTEEIKELIHKGVIKGGMIPKMECCIEALESGTNSISLVDGTIKHSLIYDGICGLGVSTTIKAHEKNRQVRLQSNFDYFLGTQSRAY